VIYLVPQATCTFDRFFRIKTNRLFRIETNRLFRIETNKRGLAK